MLSDTLAHDINNLLMIVAGCCERLSRHGALTPDQLTELQRIALATNHAGWLTAQILAASRGGNAERSCTELEAALRQCAQLLEHALGERIRIEMHLSSRKIWVPLSEGEVTQILINLALNARDAMPHGGVLAISTTAIKLDTTAAATHRLAAGEYVDLEVRDSGTGMNADTRAHAFDQFFTTKPSGRGTGLGLASVKRVVQQAGGTIDLRSLPGQGTRFTILLPIANEPANAAAADDDRVLRARSGESVLVAEDEPIVRDIVAGILRGLGYDTTEAATGEQALDLVTRQRIDLLLADVDLPDLNGRELAERLAKSSPRTRVLFMSGYNDETAETPSTIFLQKPFTGGSLGRKVREILDGSAHAKPTGHL